MSEELSREELIRRYGRKARTAPANAKRRSPFKFLDSYGVDDSDIFFGRDAEIAELLRQFHGYGHVLIYGESGAGKSSLVDCGLRSRIPEADALFIPLRVHRAGLPIVPMQVCMGAYRALGEFVETPDDARLVDALRVVREEASRPVVLFFDQFEELFIFHDAAARRRFAEELASIRKAKLNVKVVIGVRQDYLAHLSELEDTVEGLFDNRFWLRRMSRENAAAAVVQACGACDVKIDAELAHAVIHRLDPSGEGVELPYLQVVMDRLYRQAIDDNPEDPVISAADVAKLGDVAHILGTFLVEEVAKLPSPDTGRQMLKAFVTREETRRTLTRAEVAQEAAGFGEAIEQDVLDAHLKQLADVRILRQVGDGGPFELRHDALARTVAGWISEVEKELIEVRDNLLNRFKEYEARNRPDEALLGQNFMDYLAVYKKRLTPLLNDDLLRYLDKSQQRIDRKQRKARLVLGSIAAGILLVAALGVWFYIDEVRKERERALEAETLAIAAKDHALTAKRAAEQAEQRTQKLLSTSHVQKGIGELKDRNFSRAVAWFHAALEAALPDDEALRKSALALIGSYSSPAGRPLVHDSAITDVELSRDGTRILTGSEDGTARLWDAGTGAVGARLVHGNTVESIAFHPDGKTVFTGGGDGLVRRWDADTGEPRGEPLMHGGKVYAVALSPDGKTLLTAGGEAARLWDLAGGAPAPGKVLPHQGEDVRDAAFSADGKTVLTGGYAGADGVARLWDAGAGTVRITMKHDAAVLAVAFGPGSGFVVTGSFDGTVRLWNAGTGEVLRVIEEDGMVFAVAVHPDGKTLVSGGVDGVVRQWDVETGKPRGEFVRHDSAVLAATFSADGTLLTGSVDHTARLWDAGRGGSGAVMLNHAFPIQEAWFSPDGNILLTRGFFNSEAQLWDARTGEPVGGKQLHKGGMVAATFSANGKIITLDKDGAKHHWHTDGKSLKHGRAVPDPDGKRQHVATRHGMRLWDAKTRAIHGQPLDDAAPPGDALATVVTFDKDGARLWNAVTGEPRGAAIKHDGLTLGRWPLFSPDGTMILTYSEKVMSIWDARTGQPNGIPMENSQQVLDAAFSPDGKWVLAGATDNTARLWHVASQTRHAGEPVSHFTPVSAVEFHPDGDSILTGSVDGVVRLWDLHTGAVRAELKLDGSAVTLAFSPDGTMALVGNVHMKTFRGTTGILRIPQAPRADSKRLKLMVEVRTNFRLDENGALRRLTQEEWLERKGRLAARDPGR